MSVILSRNIVTSDKPALTPEQVVEQLRVLQQQMPVFVQLPKEELRLIRQGRDASVTREFAHEAIGAISTSDAMRQIVGNSPEDLHQAEDELARWSVVENEFRAVLRGVAAANLIRRDRLGRVALHAYHIGRELVRDEEHAALLPYVERMSRIRKFARRRPKAGEEVSRAQAPQVQPAPKTQTIHQ